MFKPMFWQAFYTGTCFGAASPPPTPPPTPPYGREWGLTNARPGSGHVIWEPMSGGFAPLGLLHEKGTSEKQTDKQTDKHTSRLLDQLGPEGRVGENRLCYTYIEHSKFKRILKLHYRFKCDVHFTERADFAYCWSCIGKDLHAACKGGLLPNSRSPQVQWYVWYVFQKLFSRAFM